MWRHHRPKIKFEAPHVSATPMPNVDWHRTPAIVLHSVPPVLVFLAAETAPVLRERLTEAVFAAAGDAFTGHMDHPSGVPAGVASIVDAADADVPRIVDIADVNVASTALKILRTACAPGTGQA
jgi:hypothetical protein